MKSFDLIVPVRDMTVGATQRLTIENVSLGAVLAMVMFIRRNLAIALICFTCLLNLLVPSAYAADLSPAPESAKAYIIAPNNGDTVKSPFVVQFGLSGMGIAPAGVDRPNTGHHHLLVDVDELPSLTEPLQGSKQVLHYGAGQTETELSLTPGDHTLQLVLGNYSHIPHDKPVLSEKITVTVE